MLLPIKLICPKNKVRKDGTSIIFIQYCGSDNKKTLLNTEIAIPPTIGIGNTCGFPLIFLSHTALLPLLTSNWQTYCVRRRILFLMR
jgi:hypothetical protein